MANHLKPNEPEYQDTFEDLLFSSRIFVRTLGLLLRPHGDLSRNEINEGVVIALDGKKHVVYHNMETATINVAELKEDTELVEGNWIWYHKDEE